MEKGIFISASQLSRETDYSANAIRIKRKNSWSQTDIAVKRGRKSVEIDVYKYNQWCASGNKYLDDICHSEVQFILFTKFKNLYGVTMTELSRFCDSVNIAFNSLVISAPDGKKMINLLLYRKNIYALLKYLKVI